MAINVSKEQQRVQKLLKDIIKCYGRGNLKDGRKLATKLSNNKSATAYPVFQAGIVAFNAHDLDIALKLHNLSLKLPDDKLAPHTDILISRGSLLARLNKFEDAVTDYDTAIALSPNDIRAYNNRSTALQQLGMNKEAELDLKKALELDPLYLNGTLNLLNLYHRTGKIKQAEQLVNQTTPLFQNQVNFHTCAGNIKSIQNPLESLIHYRKAAHLKPDSRDILNAYVDAFSRVANLKNFDGLDFDLLLLLSHEEVNWKRLNWIISQHLMAQPDFRPLEQELEQAITEKRGANLNFGPIVKFMTNNVLLAALKRIRITESKLEKLLETYRRQATTALANNIELDDSLKKVLLSIQIPLTKYSFMSEYIFESIPTERELADKLLQELKENSEFSLDNALKFTIVAAYIEPHRNEVLINTAQQWGATEISSLNELINTLIHKPLYEREITPKFPQLTEINDSISKSVREMYEENPYPRWDHFPYQGSTTLPDQLANALPVLESRQPELPASPEILIAGCGTGQQPISTSYAFPSAKITAVDLSLTSMAYAKRKTEELGIKNITFGQADIMELRSLGKTFDAIECGGVLHHMHDPIAGWKVLVDILKDDGFMKIALYSEIGRQDIVAARKFITENNYKNTAEDIKACRKHIMSLPEEHPVKRISRHGDFYTLSTCRDLIFHIQEHRFTIPKLEQAFEQLGLEFLGFELAQERMKEAYIDAYPEDPYRTNLKNWHEFEKQNPYIFSAMYAFWVRKKN